MKDIAISKIVKIQNTLQELIKTKGSGLQYEIAFNLSLCKGIYNDWIERVDEYRNAKYEKGDDGKDLHFILDKEGLKEDEKGKLFVLRGKTELYNSVEKLEKGESTAKRYPQDEVEEIESVIKEFENETFTPKFIKFPKDKVKEAFKNGSLDGIDVSELMDNLLKV